MAQKSSGYVELIWVCPNCETKNRGTQKTCQSCGDPQPDDVEFIQDTQAEIITDEAKIVEAKKGADIHCFYCGTRNSAGATACTQCGGDLTQGEKRQSGQVLGAYNPDPDATIVCTACDTENEANASKCVQCGAPLGITPEPKPDPNTQKTNHAQKSSSSPLGMLAGGIGLAGLGVVACVCMAMVYFLFIRTTDLPGTVQTVGWEMQITIEEERLVDRKDSDWKDSVSSKANILSCANKVRTTQDSKPSSGDYKEVCGTAYTKDKGSGYGEVVQDCKYEVYDSWCEYEISELKWTTIDKALLTGTDLNPKWPKISLRSKQREGNREANYKVNFKTSEGAKTFNTDDQQLFKQCKVGSKWMLKVNAMGGVNNIESR
ncbi:zinc finger protein [Anaerolineales bacterium HSG6]|nr:zinc finger protein [Anaerolineales bacterium HSG6]